MTRIRHDYRIATIDEPTVDRDGSLRDQGFTHVLVDTGFDGAPRTVAYFTSEEDAEAIGEVLNLALAEFSGTMCIPSRN